MSMLVKGTGFTLLVVFSWMLISLAYADKKNVCARHQIVNLCGDEELFNSIAIKMGLNTDFSELNRKEVHRVLGTMGVTGYFDINSLVLPDSHTLSLKWHRLFKQALQNRRKDIFISDVVKKEFSDIFPYFPDLTSKSIIIRMNILPTTVQVFPKRAKLDAYCQKIANLVSDADIDRLEQDIRELKKECSDGWINYYSDFEGVDDKGIKEVTRLIFPSLWVTSYYFQEFHKYQFKTSPNVILVKSGTSTSPRIDSFGNLYIPSVFISKVTENELDLVLHHEAAHIKVMATENLITSILGVLDSVVKKSSGNKLSDIQKENIYAMMRYARTPDETLVDLYVLDSLRYDRKKREKYISLVRRFETVSEDRAILCEIAGNYINLGYSPNRLAAVKIGLMYLTHPKAPFYPGTKRYFKMNNFLYSNIGESEKKIIEKYRTHSINYFAKQHTSASMTMNEENSGESPWELERKLIRYLEKEMELQ